MMMRTPPLWGIRAKSIFLHDGRADDIPTAISLHDGQRKAAVEAFQALSGSQQDELVNLLDNLWHAEEVASAHAIRSDNSV
jgi:CxxC motif-containing protein (DUF1111 family)